MEITLLIITNLGKSHSKYGDEIPREKYRLNFYVVILSTSGCKALITQRVKQPFYVERYICLM